MRPGRGRLPCRAGAWYVGAAMESTFAAAATDATDSVDALRERILELEGETQRVTPRVKDLQQQLWGRKAERGLRGPDATAGGVLALFEDAAAGATGDDAPAEPSPTATPRRPSAGARPAPSRSTRGCRAS